MGVRWFTDALALSAHKQAADRRRMEFEALQENSWCRITKLEQCDGILQGINEPFELLLGLVADLRIERCAIESSGRMLKRNCQRHLLAVPSSPIRNNRQLIFFWVTNQPLTATVTASFLGSACHGQFGTADQTTALAACKFLTALLSRLAALFLILWPDAQLIQPPGNCCSIRNQSACWICAQQHRKRGSQSKRHQCHLERGTTSQEPVVCPSEARASGYGLD